MDLCVTTALVRSENVPNTHVHRKIQEDDSVESLDLDFGSTFDRTPQGFFKEKKPKASINQFACDRKGER